MASMSSMLISEGNLRAAAGGFIGAKSDSLTTIAADLPLFGLVNKGFVPVGQSVAVNRPIAITEMRIKWVTTTAFGAAQCLAFEAHKTTATTNFTATNPISVDAQRKKVSGYSSIPQSEIDIKISAGGGLSGGNHIIQGSADAPFDSCVIAGSTVPAGESVWWPEDGIPLVIEQGEGLIVHNVVTMGASGVGLLFVQIDFFRF